MRPVRWRWGDPCAEVDAAAASLLRLLRRHAARAPPSGRCDSTTAVSYLAPLMTS